MARTCRTYGYTHEHGVGLLGLGPLCLPKSGPGEYTKVF